jgi:1-pyrroline-4-hydroxy-2-carboxylate deaminase
MARIVNWEGVYPAVLTFFNEDESLDFEMFVKNIEFQVQSGVKGIIIGGSLGENSTITHDERIALLKAAQASIGEKADILVNVAEGSTASAIKLAQRIEAEGADGIMLLPPMMYKPTEREVTEFFIAVAKAISIPIMLYNNPVDYKIEVTLDMLAELQQYDNIQALKESTRDISNVTRLRNKFGDRYKILCGVDTLALEELVMGADGWVAGLVDAFPRETVYIYNNVKAGRIDRAIHMYRWFMPLLELDIDAQLVQNIKLAAVYTGIGTEYFRSPRKPLEGERREEVIEIIREGLKTRPSLD